MTYNTNNEERDSAFSKMKKDLELANKAYQDLKAQYTILSSNQITKLRKEPSNLSLAIGHEHIKTNIVPTPSEQELLRENEFLKNRLKLQQKKMANDDVSKL